VDVGVFGRSTVPEAWDWDYVSTTSGVLPSSVVVDRNTMHLVAHAEASGVRPLPLALVSRAPGNISPLG
jgi:hypothetical protein